MRLRFIGVIYVLILSFSLLGCGYTTRSMINDKFRSIHVAPFVNKIDITREVDTASKYKIYRPMLEADITKTVANKFLFDGNLKPTEENMADLVLKGELIEFRRDPLRYTESDEVEEYRISLAVNLALWDRRQDKLVWKVDKLVGDATYFVSGIAAKSEDVAIRQAVDDLARRIVERTVEGW